MDVLEIILLITINLYLWTGVGIRIAKNRAEKQRILPWTDELDK